MKPCHVFTCYFQGVKYESIDVKKATTMECTSEDMSRDVSKMTYTDITPHKEAVTEDKDKDKDLFMTSSTSLSTCTAAASEQVQCYVDPVGRGFRGRGQGRLRGRGEGGLGGSGSKGRRGFGGMIVYV